MTAATASGPPSVSGPPRPPLAHLVGIELRKSVDTRGARWFVWLLALVTVSAAGYLVVEQTGDGPVEAARFLTVPWSVVRTLLPVIGVLT